MSRARPRAWAAVRYDGTQTTHASLAALERARRSATGSRPVATHPRGNTDRTHDRVMWSGAARTIMGSN